MKRIIIVFNFLIVFSGVSLYSQAQLEFPLTVKDYVDNSQNIVLGYDPSGTDGLDGDLGEQYIAQVPPGNFGARFRLPADTNITTIKDIRFGCGQPFNYNHNIDLSYQSGSNSMFIYWEGSQFEIIHLVFRNGYTGEFLAQYELIYGADTFNVPINLDYLNVEVQYNGPLSWPEIILHSPSGGEILEAGETVPVNYSLTIPEPVFYSLHYSTNFGNSWIFIDTISPFNNLYNWTVPNIYSTNVKLRIGNYPCVFDTSDGTFIIYNNTLPVLHPVAIPIVVNNSVGDTLELIAGMNPTATNGIDTLLGETNQPPPASGEFNSFLKLSDNSLSYIDYQPGYHSYIGSKNYLLSVYPKADSITLINLNLPSGTTLKLNYWKRIPGGISPVDTTLTQSLISYTFLPGTYYGNPFIKFAFTFDGSIPVELISFLASVNNNNVTLNWYTASEVNNAGFEIERKAPSLSPPKGETTEGWERIGFVEGEGTTTETNYYTFIDEELSRGKYYYRLKQIDFDGTFEYSKEIEVDVGIPEVFSLHQNYPNPFNPSTTISWQSPVGSWLTLKVYDVLGREVAALVDEYKDAGYHEVEFNLYSDEGQNLTSGVYFYQLKARGPETSSGQRIVETKKMILLR
ncbi:MAG: T9SS type A sorting domain-containing protein [Ignavibacteriaceae bacterium]